MRCKNDTLAAGWVNMPSVEKQGIHLEEHNFVTSCHPADDTCLPSRACLERQCVCSCTLQQKVILDAHDGYNCPEFAPHTFQLLLKALVLHISPLHNVSVSVSESKRLCIIGLRVMQNAAPCQMQRACTDLLFLKANGDHQFTSGRLQSH